MPGFIWLDTGHWGKLVTPAKAGVDSQDGDCLWLADSNKKQKSGGKAPQAGKRRQPSYNIT